MTVEINPIYLAHHWGIVRERDDPEGIGRVKLEVPGVIQRSTWALPAGHPSSGKAGLGSIEPPPLGATVLAGFEAANIEAPYYFTGPWPLGGAPAGHAVTATGDNKVFADERLKIERDARIGTSGYRITDVATSGAAIKIEMDLETLQVEVSSTLAVTIRATGPLQLTGGAVTINGRPVLPTGKPI
jgi:hypothetical protein